MSSRPDRKGILDVSANDRSAGEKLYYSFINLHYYSLFVFVFFSYSFRILSILYLYPHPPSNAGGRVDREMCGMVKRKDNRIEIKGREVRCGILPFFPL